MGRGPRNIWTAPRVTRGDLEILVLFYVSTRRHFEFSPLARKEGFALANFPLFFFGSRWRAPLAGPVK